VGSIDKRIGERLGSASDSEVKARSQDDLEGSGSVKSSQVKLKVLKSSADIWSANEPQDG
jgi:hypothetical protein